MLISLFTTKSQSIKHNKNKHTETFELFLVYDIEKCYSEIIG